MGKSASLSELKLVGQFSRSMVKYSKAATRDSRRMLLPVHVCPRCLLLFLDPYLKFPSLMMMRLISALNHIVGMHFRIGYITFHERERVSPPPADFICATGTAYVDADGSSRLLPLSASTLRSFAPLHTLSGTGFCLAIPH